MRILEWTEKDLRGLSKQGVSRVLTESDADGRIVREIGLVGDEVRYIASAVDPEIERRGMFDLQMLAPECCTGPDDVPRVAFEEYWRQGRL